MSDHLEAFYKARWRLCEGFNAILERRLLMIGRQEGFINRSFPESTLREVVNGACEEIRRDLYQQGLPIDEATYQLLKQWIIEKKFGATKRQWVRG